MEPLGWGALEPVSPCPGQLGAFSTGTHGTCCLANSFSVAQDRSAWPDTQNKARDSRRPAQPWLSPACGRMGPQEQSLGSLCSRPHPEVGGPPQGNCQRCLQTSVDVARASSWADPGISHFTATSQWFKAGRGHFISSGGGTGGGRRWMSPFEEASGEGEEDVTAR